MTWASSSALAPAGTQAARLAHVIWIFLGICSLVYVVMLVLLVAALVRPDASFDESRRLKPVAIGGVLTTAILVALLIVTVQAGRGLNPMRDARDVLTVRVTARQWWWEFRYPGNAPDQEVTTANELHIPVGKPILLELISRDVIHSFWVPSLYGKRDLIPGHDSTTYIEADRAGVFRGQCAEFCGAQHAKMGFLVIAEPPSTFEAWLEHQRSPAADPKQLAEPARRGRQVFLRGTCPMCHTVAGTIAGAAMGPNLTHVASRTTLGAGTIPDEREHLARWVGDSQAIKPGNRMPPSSLPPNEFADLLSYLETLR
jgi:cytochrome c oxidase subunit 2